MCGRSRAAGLRRERITLWLLLADRARLTHVAPVGTEQAPESPDVGTHVLREKVVRLDPGSRTCPEALR
ncbi:hypothetical protein [Sphingosinicella terrae]|uniref:hypothetical protein n=1 Tax=Sphingosinicella terrae TaxID=2172047 RepID=UPI000E0CF447|nr:hypothetical protein [Sphingosinicella terrae]